MDRIPAFEQQIQPDEPELLFTLPSDPPGEPVSRIRRSLQALLDEMVHLPEWKKYLDNQFATDHERALEYDIKDRLSYVRGYLVKLFNAVPNQIIETGGILQWFRKKVTPIISTFRVHEAVKEREKFLMRQRMFRPGALESIEAHMGFDITRDLEEDLLLLVPEQRLVMVREHVRGAAKYVIALDEDMQWDAKRPLYQKKG